MLVRYVPSGVNVSRKSKLYEGVSRIDCSKFHYSSTFINSIKSHQIYLFSSRYIPLDVTANTSEMHNSYNQFLFHTFLFAVHVSNESSRSSSVARHNILYYTVWYNRYNRAGGSSC